MVKAAKKDTNAAPLQLDDLKDKTCVETGREEWKDEISGLVRYLGVWACVFVRARLRVCRTELSLSAPGGGGTWVRGRRRGLGGRSTQRVPKKRKKKPPRPPAADTLAADPPPSPVRRRHAGRRRAHPPLSKQLYSKSYDSLTKKQKQKVGGHRLALNRKVRK